MLIIWIFSLSVILISLEIYLEIYFFYFASLVDEPAFMCVPANLEFLVLNGSYFQRVLGYLSSLIYAHIKLEFKCYVLTD